MQMLALHTILICLSYGKYLHALRRISVKSFQNLKKSIEPLYTSITTDRLILSAFNMHVEL